MAQVLCHLMGLKLSPILIPRFLAPSTELYISIGMVQCRHRHLRRAQLLLAVVRAADLAVQGALLVVVRARAGQSTVVQPEEVRLTVVQPGAGRLTVGLPTVGLLEVGAVIPV